MTAIANAGGAVLGQLHGARIERQQALQLRDAGLGLSGLGVDVGEVLGGGSVALVDLGGAAQLGDGGARGACVGRRLPEQRPPQRRAVVGLVGDQPGRLPEGLDRLVMAAGAQVLEADLVERMRGAAGWRGGSADRRGGRFGDGGLRQLVSAVPSRPSLAV